MIESEAKKNKIEHNEEILREIWNRIMIEIWSIIPTSLLHIPQLIINHWIQHTCFKPLKTYWVKVCHKYLFANPNRVITNFQFFALFAEAWSKCMSISNITSGFCTIGVFPFNPKALLDRFLN